MVDNTLGKKDEYRKHAASLLELAARTANNTDKGRLLLISEAWLNLSDKIARLAGRRDATERLVREMFGEHRPDAE
jgi:MoxR-like ATPase